MYEITTEITTWTTAGVRVSPSYMILQLFKYPVCTCRVGVLHMAVLAVNPGDAAMFMGRASQLKLFGKIRLALIYSVLSSIMKILTPIYKQTDIIIVALTLYFVCTIVNTIILRDATERRQFHSGYILRSICRQSILIISSTIAQMMGIHNAGTQIETTMFLIFSTTTFLAILSLIPHWFLQDRTQGSLADILIYSYTTMYKQIHIPGLHGTTGLGMLIYGILFVLVNILSTQNEKDGRHTSKFRGIMYNAVSMLLSTQFIKLIIPVSSSQVLPIAILIAMYILSSRIQMSTSVAAFVLFQTGNEISTWVTQMFGSDIVDKMFFFSLLLCILPVFNHSTASVLFISAVQTVVAYLMHSFSYIGETSAALASIGLLLVTDILLDIPT
jgi:hypothetical protein